MIFQQKVSLQIQEPGWGGWEGACNKQFHPYITSSYLLKHGGGFHVYFRDEESETGGQCGLILHQGRGHRFSVHLSFKPLTQNKNKNLESFICSEY